MYLNLHYFNPRHTISFNGMLLIWTLCGCKIVAQEDRNSDCWVKLCRRCRKIQTDGAIEGWGVETEIVLASTKESWPLCKGQTFTGIKGCIPKGVVYLRAESCLNFSSCSDWKPVIKNTDQKCQKKEKRASVQIKVEEDEWVLEQLLSEQCKNRGTPQRQTTGTVGWGTWLRSHCNSK